MSEASATDRFPLPPNATIGILGGGHLGRMSALAAAELGYRCHVYAPEADSPGMQVSAARTVAAYEDPAALAAFARAVDVVTFEFENVPAATLEVLAPLVPCRPGRKALAICQDRLQEKAFLAQRVFPSRPGGRWRAWRSWRRPLPRSACPPCSRPPASVMTGAARRCCARRRRPPPPSPGWRPSR